MVINHVLNISHDFSVATCRLLRHVLKTQTAPLALEDAMGL